MKEQSVFTEDKQLPSRKRNGGAVVCARPAAEAPMREHINCFLGISIRMRVAGRGLLGRGGHYKANNKATLSPVSWWCRKQAGQDANEAASQSARLETRRLSDAPVRLVPQRRYWSTKPTDPKLSLHMTERVARGMTEESSLRRIGLRETMLHRVGR